MDLKEARKLIQRKHLDESIRLVAERNGDGYEWLLNRTGRDEPQLRYIVFDGVRYPTKAFGFLVAQIAGGTDRKTNDMTVNEAAAPLKKLGGKEVRLEARAKGRREQGDAEEARKVSYYRRLARPEQAKFRRSLLESYGRCAISGADVERAVEAAHVKEFAREGLDTLQNGILLRSDLHNLFDAGHLAIDPATMTAHFSVLCHHHYSPNGPGRSGSLQGVKVVIPAGGPPPSSFQDRWKAFIRAHAG
jgi:hypothetical protein